MCPCQHVRCRGKQQLVEHNLHCWEGTLDLSVKLPSSFVWWKEFTGGGGWCSRVLDCCLAEMLFPSEVFLELILKAV